MTSGPVKVAIVTPVHNRRELTLLCLRSLSRIDTSGLELSVWIVDDGSTDGTSEAVRQQFPEVNLVAGDGDLWYTEGTNVGVREALKWEPDFVLMMNDDQVFDELFLTRLVTTAIENPRSVVGSVLLLWDQPHKVFQVAPVWNTWDGGWRHWRHQTIWSIPEGPWEVDLIVGNCVLVPVGALLECGLMDSERYPNFGDVEFTPRLKQRGWKLLIEPRSRVFCQPNTPPPRVRGIGVRKMYSALIGDLRNPHNLRRRLQANIDVAPSKLAGVTAFGVFLTRALLGQSPESERWSEASDEAPLKETFKTRTLNG